MFGHVWATAATVSPFAIQFKHGTVEKTVLLDVVGYKRLEEGVFLRYLRKVFQWCYIIIIYLKHIYYIIYI